jgi:carbamoyltransferase
MNVLGITGRDRDAAAALAVDGRIVAAATEESLARVAGIGYAQAGGFPTAAVKACMSIAGLEPRDIHELVVAGDAASHAFHAAPARTLDAVHADALHAAASDPSSTSVVICSANPPVLAAFAFRDGRLGPRVDVNAAESLVALARDLAGALGLEVHDPFASLDRLSLGAEPEFQAEIGTVLRWNGAGFGSDGDPAALSAVARHIAGEHASGLADAASLNAQVQRTRRALAASFTSHLARTVAAIAEGVGAKNGPGPIAVGGGAFGNARFNTELAPLIGQALSYAAVPEAFGRALGAAGGASVNGSGLALGPAFSEEDIKRTLDNCRLDYVYEPDWKRLLARVSRMLAQGKVVGWFQGAMTFGPRALGTRSILCDPSNRYARQNMNEYLRQAPIDEPLPLALASSMVDACLASGARVAGVSDVAVRREWRQSLAAALDWRHRARVHPLARGVSPRFQDLLDVHYAATGTPGLIEANLAGPGEPAACTPRDAVRTVYSSAIDALVIGRFLLMKDYWLLRSQD